MNNTDLVSIIINNYNYETYVGAAIQSAIQQTYQNCEVIVVDDGSTDDSISVIESFGSQIKTILKPNGGQASAFNTGIDAAEGRFIILLDSDDMLLDNAVEECLAFIDPEAIRLCYRLQKVGSSGEELRSKPLGLNKCFLGTMRDTIVNEGFFPGTPTSGNFFRAKELRRCLPVPEDLYRISADLYLFCKNAHYGKIQMVQQVLGCYRIHGSNHFANSVGRFDMPVKRLSNHLENVLNRRDLLLIYAKGMPDCDKMERFSMPMYAMATVSDAKLRGVYDERLKYWTKGEVLRGTWNAFNQGPRLSVRNAVIAVTILLNELLPNPAGKLIYQICGMLSSCVKRIVSVIRKHD